MTSLQGKICVVTGSSRGIGRGTAIALGEQGATVYVTGRSTGDGELTVDTTARLVSEAGGDRARRGDRQRAAATRSNSRWSRLRPRRTKLGS